MPRKWILQLSAEAPSDHPLYPLQGAVFTYEELRSMPHVFIALRLFKGLAFVWIAP